MPRGVVCPWQMGGHAQALLGFFPWKTSPLTNSVMLAFLSQPCCHSKWPSTFRNFTINTRYSSGHCKGKAAHCWMSNKEASWPPTLLLLFQSSQERSTTLDTKPLLWHQTSDIAQPRWELRCSCCSGAFSFPRMNFSWLSTEMQPQNTNCSLAAGSPGTLRTHLSFRISGGFRITRFGMMICLLTGCLHRDFPVAINCYHSSPTAAACTVWGLEEGEKYSSWFISLIYGLQ